MTYSLSTRRVVSRHKDLLTVLTDSLPHTGRESGQVGVIKVALFECRLWSFPDSNSTFDKSNKKMSRVSSLVV